MKIRLLLAALLLLPASVQAEDKSETREAQELHTWSYFSLQSQFAKTLSFWNTYCFEPLDCPGREDSYERMLYLTIGQSVFSNSFLQNLDEGENKLALSPASLQALAQERSRLRAEITALRTQTASRLGQDPAQIDAQFKASLQAMLERRRQSSIKANMHTIQTIVETYAVDFEGSYAPTLKALYAEAIRPERDYWKDIVNPVSNERDLERTVADFKAFRPGDPAFAGMVLYQPDPNRMSYKIYGVDTQGQLIMDGDQPFVLTNY